PAHGRNATRLMSGRRATQLGAGQKNPDHFDDRDSVATSYHRSPLLGIVPAVHVLTNLILGNPISLLQLAFKLLPSSINDVQVVIRQLSPLLLHLTFNLLPISFHAIPVHH